MGREIAMETGIGSAVARMENGRVLASLGCQLCGRESDASGSGMIVTRGVAVCAGCAEWYGMDRCVRECRSRAAKSRR